VSYAIVDGRIGAKPDRIYPTNTQGPLAVDAAGNLYASMGGCVVTVYAPNSTQVLRTLNVGPGPSNCFGYDLYETIAGIAVDDRGYLYVGLYWEGSGSVTSRGARPAKRGEQSEDCYDYSCTYVYAPGASGDAAPVATLSLGNPGAGMTTDHAGNLYLQNGDSIIVIAHPTTRPKQVRTIVPKGLSGIANPLIDDGLLYASITQCDDNTYPCKNGIGVFRAGADGTVAPLRYFVEPIQEWWGGFAIGGAGVYVLTAASIIQVFDKQAQGEVMPLFSQILYPQPTYPSYEAIGP
jgi:hypothetical protein